MACQILHQLLLCAYIDFSALVRAHEAAPGALLANNAPPAAAPEQKIRPLATQVPILLFWDSNFRIVFIDLKLF